MSLLSEHVPSVLSSQQLTVFAVRVSNDVIVNNPDNVPFVDNIVNSTFEIGEATLQQIGTVLNLPTALFEANLVVTHLSINDPNLETVTINFTDSAGVQHTFQFVDGLLTSYSSVTTQYTLAFSVNTSIISPGSTPAKQFKLPLISTGTYTNMVVDWGDGTSSTVASWNDPATTMHTYTQPQNIYTISITGTCHGWVFNNTGDCLKMLDITAIGPNFRLGTNEGFYFDGCSNMNITSMTTFNLTGTTNMNNAFARCTILNSPAIAAMDVSNVQTMVNLFLNAKAFNQDLSSWNMKVANVTDMCSTFEGAEAFNNGGQPLNWITTALQYTASMFWGAKAFNQNLSNWSANLGNLLDTANMFDGATAYNNGGQPLTWVVPMLTRTSEMFKGATSFNQPVTLTGLAINDMSGMFNGATSFNQTITLNTTNLTDVNNMFNGATAFNQNVASWDMSDVLDMSNMFNGAIAFNNGGQPLTWTTTKVTNCSGTFNGAKAFNQAIDSWYLGDVLTMSYMFANTDVFNNGGSPGINKIIYRCTDFSHMFENALAFNQQINDFLLQFLGVGTINCSFMFHNAQNFNQNIGNWVTTQVTNMEAMFKLDATIPGKGFSNAGGNLTWDVSNVVNAKEMFRNASLLNTYLVNWDVSKVTDMSYMFAGTQFTNSLFPMNWTLSANAMTPVNCAHMFQDAYDFDLNISGWVNVNNVSNMSYMFASSAFNNGGMPLTWTASKCTNFSYMFQSALSFNQPVNTLVNTGTVAATLEGMFQNARSFNQNVGAWVVSNVTNMSYMFDNPSDFDNNPFNNGGSTDILTWVASKCIDFSYMFHNCYDFNQPIPNLVKSNLLTPPATCILDYMFYIDSQEFYNPSFNQDLSNWKVDRVSSMTGLFRNSFFNNAGASAILNWTAPLCTSFAEMFQNCVFNQPLTNLVKTAGVTSCSLRAMFQNAQMNPDIMTYNWDWTNVTNVSYMFSHNNFFNNGGSDSIKNLSLPKCTDFSYMFEQSVFNQPLTNLVNTNAPGITITSCSLQGMFAENVSFNQNINSWNFTNVTNMNSMFLGIIGGIFNAFNNGEVLQTSVAPATNMASYNNSTRVLYSPASNFVATVTSGSVLLVFTSGIIHIGVVDVVTDAIHVTFVPGTNFGSDYIAGTITAIWKQLEPSGANTPNWDTGNVTDMTSMFKLNVYFNQSLSGFNMNKVTKVDTMFQGTNNYNTLFNNGQLITGTTSPLNWMFNNAPTSTDWRQYNRLTLQNRTTTPQLP